MKKAIPLVLLLVSTFSFSQVGIGTTNPNASAALDVSSTTKGFLPPRATYVERDAITSPPTGLIIWCSNCGSSGEIQVYNGTTWTNISGTTASYGRPTAPTSPVATIGNAQASVEFTAPASNGGSVITGYTVTSFPGNLTATGTGTPIVVTGLTNGTSYTFTVVATNAAGGSVASIASTAVTPRTIPGAPTSPNATPGNTQASVAFSAPASNGGSAITGYAVTSFPGNLTATGTGTPIIVTGLTNGTSYTFTVVATNAAGDSVASASSSAVTPFTVPGAPTSPIATPGNAQASVAFTAPASNGDSVITGYTVTSSPDDKIATGTVSPIVVTGLTNGTSYTFTVVATNAAGNSVASEASTAVTPITVPDAPTSPIATKVNAQASVAFTAPASDGGSAITGYTVTSTPGSFTATGTSSPIVFTNLKSGITYTFRVVATNALGNSLASAASNAITTDCGAFVATGIWKRFSCYNLGVTGTSLDPNIPVKGIHGDYYQWGRTAPAGTVDAIISTWESQGGTSDNGNWTSTGTGGPNNPCPTGFRVPSQTEWNGVINSSLNTVSRTGTWGSSSTNFTVAISFGPSTTVKTLTLPTSGMRSNTNGSLAHMGLYGLYWSSTESSTSAVYFESRLSTTITSILNRQYGLSVRCISE